ncbi:hypothetical protein [Aurantimonas sp. 22II-16-19i]|uniref:hypothetical protein n=1 Tax=Aurantimonas sp. 22II-16-19i TaxID=1317114 RepID=UPI0009F7B762|nr:hypothetical protein [Aurantimonas sp. 22II-16-19i]ORE90965.1 hypothetical protein ATO4_19924 [Aurantimonas sp. 22II-16-19i]
MSAETTAPAFEGWAILELMGHRVRPGRVSEVEIAASKMLRVDIPVGVGEDEYVTEYYGGASVYSLRPTSEDIARRMARDRFGADPRPVRPVDYRPAIAASDEAPEYDDVPEYEP